MTKIPNIIDLIPDVQEHIVMRDKTSFKVGGVADYYYETKTINDLIKVVKIALQNKITYFILGNGSNILFSDYGYPGLVIKNMTSNIAVMKEKSQVIVDSGVMLARLIIEAANHELSGLEFLYGVPGTVGGAVYGNAGAYGHAIGDYIKNITLLTIDPEKNEPKIVQYKPEWFEFDYRNSKLKKIKSRAKPVILTIRFQFAQNQKTEIMRKIKFYQDDRIKTQPLEASAGCIFKNPIPKELKNIIGKGTKGMPDLPKQRRAGFMLDQAGVKKLQVQSAEVSDRHANFIVNKGNAKANEIRTLIEEMREKVKNKYNITLEEEIEYIGQW